MKVLFIVNPVAGKGRAKKIASFIKEIMIGMKEQFYEICFTEYPGHATELAKLGVGNGYDIVFAVGGDGTVNEVMNGLIGTKAALAVLPGGSGNDFARSIGASEEIGQAIKGALEGNIKPIDVGIINGRYFINISSVGFDAEVVMATQKFKKLFFAGSAAYVAGLIYTIFTAKPKKINIKADGVELDKSVLLTAIANGRYYGGGMKAAPNAVIDDGMFDVCIIEWLSKLKLLLFFPKFIKGKHEVFKEVSFLRSENVLIRSDLPIAINVDGETYMDKDISFNIIKNGLLVAMP